MSKEYMNSSLNMEGELCGVKTTLLADCIEDELLFSAEVEITKDSLKELLKLFGSVTKEKVGDYVELLNDFEVKALFAHSNQQTMLEVRTEALKFLAYDENRENWLPLPFFRRKLSMGKTIRWHR